MKNEFQIDMRHQIKSMQNVLILFSFSLVIIIIGGLFEIFDLKDFLFLFLTLILICCAFSLPAIYLHINYLLENWGTILTVDKSRNEFSIKTKEGDFYYGYEDLESVELNLATARRKSTPWIDYGYIKIRMKDGKEFSFTSLMMDLYQAPFSVTERKLRIVPYLRKKQ